MAMVFEKLEIACCTSLDAFTDKDLDDDIQNFIRTIAQQGGDTGKSINTDNADIDSMVRNVMSLIF